MRFEKREPSKAQKVPQTSEPTLRQDYIYGSVQSGAGPVPRISTRLASRDHLGAWAVRLGFKRDRYLVEPGLCAIGSPKSDSPVLVSANYKLSFDCLRKELSGLDAWILVLDTKGVNVWCSAGKGTFGNTELAKRIRLSRLGLVVEHRDLVVPQLSATGIGAPAVQRETGWKVHFGPVRAHDLPAYLAAGMIKTEAMRRMDFQFIERIKLIPLELIHALPRLGLLFILWLLAAFVGQIVKGIPITVETGMAVVSSSVKSGGMAWLAVTAAVLCGTGLVPALLPWIPFQAFAGKGFLAGMLLSLAWIIVGNTGVLEAVALMLTLPAISAWMALNFTGCTTYTSLAGVKAEIAALRIPLITMMILGLGLRTILLIVTGS